MQSVTAVVIVAVAAVRRCCHCHHWDFTSPEAGGGGSVLASRGRGHWIHRRVACRCCDRRWHRCPPHLRPMGSGSTPLGSRATGLAVARLAFVIVAAAEAHYTLHRLDWYIATRFASIVVIFVCSSEGKLPPSRRPLTTRGDRHSRRHAGHRHSCTFVMKERRGDRGEEEWWDE